MRPGDLISSHRNTVVWTAGPDNKGVMGESETWICPDVCLLLAVLPLNKQDPKGKTSRNAVYLLGEDGLFWTWEHFLDEDFEL